MTAELRLARFLKIAATANGQKYIHSICHQHPQVARWFHHFLSKCAAHSVLEYKDGRAHIRSTGLLTKAAQSTGRLIAAEVRLSRRWHDARAIFKALLAITACSPTKEIAHLMVDTVPELYDLLCSEEGQLLVAIVHNKPVYMNMPSFDIIVPRSDQGSLHILRRTLNNHHTPADKLAQSFNAALTRALKVILSFSWIFFDDQTMHLIATRLLGAKILFCPPAAPPSIALQLEQLQTANKVPLPRRGLTLPAPENKAGVSELTLWERGQWLLGLLRHGNAGTTMTMISPFLQRYLSPWLLIADGFSSSRTDPLAQLTLSAYSTLDPPSLGGGPGP